MCRGNAQILFLRTHEHALYNTHVRVADFGKKSTLNVQMCTHAYTFVFYPVGTGYPINPINFARWAGLAQDENRAYLAQFLSAFYGL